jgi:hypothetical protein
MKKREYLFLVIINLFRTKFTFIILIFFLQLYFIDNEPEILYHPKSCYTSRKFNYSAKLNETLLQDELSNKIVIINDENDNNDEISKNLGKRFFLS